jgi:hypothetical protein
MATSHTTIERRIDMILESPRRPSKRREGGLLTFACLLAWSGFVLAGSTGAIGSTHEQDGTWPATVEAVEQHAVELYQRVARHAAADVNGDGVVTYLEKDTYLVALAMRMSSAFVEAFPYADRNHSDALDILEAHDAIRGITLIAYADRRPTAAPDCPLDLEFYHEALDAQTWLLDHMATEPSAGDLDRVWSVLKRIQSPSNADHVRKLNHGGPEPPGRGGRCKGRDLARFQELEGHIASIEAKLADTEDPEEIARLRAMLSKLEAVLSKLESR